MGTPGSAFVGRGLGEVAEGLLHLEKQKQVADLAIKDGEDSVRGTQAITNLALKMEEAEQFAKANAEPENHLSTWREQVATAQQETRESFSGFGREKKVQFDQALARMLSTAEIGVSRNQQERRIDRQVADGSKSFDDLITLATKASTPAQRDFLLEQAGAIPGALARTGSLKETQAADWIRRGKEKVTQGRGAYFATGLKEELDNLKNEGLRNPDRAEDLFNRGQRKIRDAGADWLPAEKIDEAISDFKNGLWVGTLKTAIDDNPQRAKAELKSGKYDDKLTQQSLISLHAEADAEIERRRARAEAERKEGVRQIGKAVTDFKEAKMAGFDWAGNEADLATAVRGTEHQADFEFISKASAALAQFNKLAPAEQEVQLRGLVGKPMSGDGAKFAATLQTAHERTKAGLKQDPITFAIRQRSVPAGPALDLNSPDSLKARSVIAGMVENRYGLSAVSPLTDDEAAKLVTDMAKAPADKRALTMRQLNQFFTPQQVHAVAAQIDKKGQGELAQAFGMSSQVPEVTSRILQGMEAKRANKEVLPAGVELRDMDAAINKKLADAYKADPNAFDSVRDAVKSYYAWGRWNVGDLSAKLDTKALDRAIYAVSGGVMDFNGAPTLPPRYGVTEDQMRALIKDADFSSVMGDIKAKTVLDYGKLTAVGPGLYRVTIGGSPVFGKDEKPFTLDLGRVKVTY